jgi:hypothetical protein
MGIGTDGATWCVKERHANASRLATNQQHSRHHPAVVQNADAKRASTGEIARIVGPFIGLAEVASTSRGYKVIPEESILDQSAFHTICILERHKDVARMQLPLSCVQNAARALP